MVETDVGSNTMVHLGQEHGYGCMFTIFLRTYPYNMGTFEWPTLLKSFSFSKQNHSKQNHKYFNDNVPLKTIRPQFSIAFWSPRICIYIIKNTLFYSPRIQTRHCSRTAQKSTSKVSFASEGKFLKLWASNVKKEKARYIGGTMVQQMHSKNAYSKRNSRQDGKN